MERGKDSPAIYKRKMQRNTVNDMYADSIPIIMELKRVFYKNIQLSIQYFENVPHYKPGCTFGGIPRTPLYNTNLENIKII